MLVYGAGAAWCHLFLPGAGADPIWSEPESAPGPRISGSGAAKKSVGSATLVFLRTKFVVKSKFWQKSTPAHLTANKN